MDLSGVALEFSVRLPLEQVTLEVEAKIPSGVTCLLGHSGAGKTSLLESLLGIRPKSQGRVVLQGRVLQDLAGRNLPPEQRFIGYVPQDTLLFPHLTVEGNVRFGARSRAGRPTWEHWIHALELSPLMGRRPKTLSGGERQRVALARALATCPDALLLDEPLSGLDAETKGRLLRMLSQAVFTLPLPTLFATHHPDDVDGARGTLRLEAGRVALRS